MTVETAKTEPPIIVDATNQVVGRMASHIAKLLLEDRRVIVVNAEKALISGSRANIVSEQMARLKIASVVNPKYNPHRFREPDRMLHRTIRGMLPRRQPKGQAAFKRLRVYIGTPEMYRSVTKEAFEDAKARKPLPFYVTLGELALTLGWRER